MIFDSGGQRTVAQRLKAGRKTELRDGKRVNQLAIPRAVYLIAEIFGVTFLRHSFTKSMPPL